jgi:hypothetical protein
MVFLNTVLLQDVQTQDSQLLQLTFHPSLSEALGLQLSASLSPMAKTAVHSNDQGQSMQQAGHQSDSHDNRGCLLWIQTRPLSTNQPKFRSIQNFDLTVSCSCHVPEGCH